MPRFSDSVNRRPFPRFRPGGRACGGREGEKIWACGGASIAQRLMEADLIDEYTIFVIPTILGAGIRLFGTLPGEIKLKLVHTRTDHGITDLLYTRR